MTTWRRAEPKPGSRRRADRTWRSTWSLRLYFICAPAVLVFVIYLLWIWILLAYAAVLVARIRARRQAMAHGFKGRCRFDAWTWEFDYRVALKWPQLIDGSERVVWVGVPSLRRLQGVDAVEVWGDVANPEGALFLRAGDKWIEPVGPHIWLPAPLGGPYMVAPVPGHELAASTESIRKEDAS